MIDILKILASKAKGFRLGATCVLGLGLVATDAVAGPYDATKTRPGTEITNTAILTYGVGISPDPVEMHHDLTVLPFDDNATLRLFREARPNEDSTPVFIPQDSEPLNLFETDRILAGTDLFAVLDHAGLNFDSGTIDRVEITTTDALSGDRETLTLIETSPDSGRFVAPFCTCATAATQGDEEIYTQPHSRIDVFYQDPWRPERELRDAVFVGPIDPFGILFDSRTGAPLSGVEVTIVDVSTGAPAQVFGADLKSSYPATLTTGSTVIDSTGVEYDLDPGQYRFPYVGPGTYRLEVVPPRGYVAPSEVPDSEIQSLAAAPFSLAAGSRLDAFEINPGSTLEMDVPLDGSALIEVQRLGSTDIAALGDALKFTVTASTPLRGGFPADILDTLPNGLTLVPGSVMINGVNGEDRTEIGPRGRNIVFDDVLIPDGGSARVTYVARIGVAAREGDVLTSSSTAEAHGFIANTAFHDLEIEPVFHTDRSILLGQVYANGCEASYQPDLDLSGIRLLIENGRYVETDEAGLFSFRNLTPGTHVVAIDPLSLPAGFKPVLCENSTRRAGRAGSIFVDASGGFAQQAFLHIAPAKGISLRSPRADEEVPTQARVHDLDQNWLDKTPMRTGVAFPKPGYLPRTQSLELAVLRKPGHSVEVTLNGATLEAVHRRPALPRSDGSGYLDIWNGAPLKHGINDVHVIIRGLRGEIVHQDHVEIGFNDEVRQLDYIRKDSQPSTDGHRQPYIVLRATDEEGIPLHPGMRVGLSISSPFAFAGKSPQDLETRRTMATVDPDGLIRLHLAPSRLSGTAQITALAGDTRVTTDVFISAAERPWVIVGLAEGTAAHRDIAQHMVAPGQRGIADLGPLRVDGRVALYAEGVIDGKWLTTLRYDSAIDEDNRDFFDIDPSAQYIVYGDSSVEGDAAQSRHALYLRLSSEQSDFLYGDFDTEIDEGLAEYNRRLTGAQVEWRGERLKTRAFIARTAQSFLSDSFEANGTSGPFDLEGEDILPFSERVRVETLHRTDRDRIKNEYTLRRGTDYDIDYRTGRIFLAEPLRARDSSLDPNILVVDYEIETPHDEGLIVGTRTEIAASDDLTLGLTAVHQDHIAGSDGAGQIAGVDFTQQITDELVGRAELAFSHQEASNSLAERAFGHAAEISLDWSHENSEASAYLRSQSSNFGIENQNQVSTHVISAGLSANLALSEQRREDEEGNVEILTRRAEIGGDLEHDIDRNDLTLSFKGLLHRDSSAATGFTSRGYGFELTHEDRSGAEAAATGLKAIGLSEWTSRDGRLSLSLGQELTLATTDHARTPDIGSLEASYAVNDRVTLKATNEIAWGDEVQADIMAFGAEISPWSGALLDFGTLYATDGATGAVIGHAGIDQDIALSDIWTLSGGVEHQARLDDDDDGPVALAGLSHERIGEGFTTFTLGFDRSGEDWKFSSGFEYRLGDVEDVRRIHALASSALRKDLDFGAKASFLEAENHETGEGEIENRVEASLAWRPLDARFALLDQLILRRESSIDADSFALTHSTFYTRELDGGHQVNLRHGIKYARQDFDGTSYDDVLNLVGAEYRHNLMEWFDIGTQASVLYSAATGTTRKSAGLSLGITPFENGWLSLGYNFAGFHDEDFSTLGYTDEGAYLQFRIKFDRETLSPLTP